MYQEIELAILANCSILYVVTQEEDRFVRFMEGVCGRKNRRMWIYSISDGLLHVAFTDTESFWFTTKKERVKEQLKDPVTMLEHLKMTSGKEGVFVLLDFHEYLRDPLVRRLLKDLARRFKTSRNSIVISAPLLELPRSIESEISVAAFPLPEKTELGEVLEAALKALRKRGLKIDLNAGDKERLAIAGQGMTRDQFEECLAKAVVECRGIVDADIIEHIISGKKQIIRKTGLLEFFDRSETMDQVGGLLVLKDWLSKRQQAFTRKARSFGLPSPKGILLLGIQGCGKSLTAKACASLWRFPLLRLDTGRLFSSQIGSSEASTRRAIQLAEAISPCVLWIDEIEKAMAGVGSSSFSDAGTTARVFATIATWLQEKTAPVFVIATANSVASLPPELIRKGRWDEIFFLDLPGRAERQSILRIHLERNHRNPKDFDVEALARHCPDYSGAEIEQAVIGGLYDAFDQGRPLETKDILRNLKAQVPLSKTMAEDIQAMRAWARDRARFASERATGDPQDKWRHDNVRSI